MDRNHITLMNLFAKSSKIIFTLNLFFAGCKKIQINSSFGYGSFVRVFYNNYFNHWEKSVGIGGLISIGVKYIL